MFNELFVETQNVKKSFNVLYVLREKRETLRILNIVETIIRKVLQQVKLLVFKEVVSAKYNVQLNNLSGYLQLVILRN